MNTRKATIAQASLIALLATCFHQGSAAAPGTAIPPPSEPSSRRDDVAFRGVSAAMWAEIDERRSIFGDPNNCRARIAAIPTSGGVTLKAGADINAALSLNDIVFLSGGTYKLSTPVRLDAGKKLIGLPGQTVTLDASAVQEAIQIRDSAVLANVNVRDAINVGVNFYEAKRDRGSSNSVVYQVSVGRTGLSPISNADGVGFGVWYGASHNCIVSTEAFDSWNEAGTGSPVTADGGNADGYRNSFGAHHNTFIDSHSYRNGDDGFDFWEGGVAYVYFSTAFDIGRTTGKSHTGDGNGFKLGRGNVRHYLYRSSAYNNKANGFDINGNLMRSVLIRCEAHGNGKLNFAGTDR